jgi:nitrogen fixation protein FixH
MTARRHDDAGGRWIPLCFVAGLGLLVAVQACFAYLAISTDPGVAVPNAYERGLAHNAVLHEAAKEAALGWRVTLENRSGTGHSGTLVVVAADGGTRRLDDLAVTGLVQRPLQGGLDARLAFHNAGNGVYLATYDLPLPGLWQIDLLLERGTAREQRSMRFSAP